MLKTIKTLLKRSSLFIAIGITVLITYLSLIKLNIQTVSFSHLDKVEHLIAYSALTLSWLLALQGKVKVIVIIILCIAFGILIEVLQKNLTTYRTADIYDIVANTIGILIALIIFKIFFEKKRAI